MLMALLIQELFNILMVVAAVFVIDGTSHEPEKFQPNRLSHEVV